MVNALNKKSINKALIIVKWPLKDIENSFPDKLWGSKNNKIFTVTKNSTLFILTALNQFQFRIIEM